MAGFLTRKIEKQAQQEIMKRAMDAAWIASTCIGMVIGPTATYLEMGNATKSDVNNAMDAWLRGWRDVQQLSDRNLHRNREYHVVRPNVTLSTILSGFGLQLESIRSSALEPSQMLQQVKEAYTTTTVELLDWLKWAKQAGGLIDFDGDKYELEAVQRAQTHWASTVRELKKRMG
jgi:hypothetical protein